MTHNILRTTTVTAFLIAAGSSFALAADTDTAAQPEQKLPAIVVTEATTRPLVDRVVATGSIKAVEDVYVQPLVEGLSIKSLNADVGDRVEADSILATLSDDSLLLQKSQLNATMAKAHATLAQIKAQVIEVRANAEDAERQRDRAINLSRSGTTSASQVEQLTAAAAAANARLEATQQAVAVAEAELEVIASQIADIDLKLARTGVKTPVGGTVAARSARIGAIATGGGEPLFTIIRDGDLELVADVSENDILKIRSGQKATITVAGRSAPLTGSVRLVSPTVNPLSRLGAVHVAIDDDQAARAGMYASAEIIIEETTGLSLPLSAVTSGRDGSTARKVENDVVRQVQVVTGIQDGSYIQIVSGLEAGDQVVAKAGAFVRDGDRISPVASDAAVSN